MPLIPRWRYMTPQARQQTRRMAIGAGILVLVILLKLPLPWVLLALAGWWLWGQLQR
ncbi:MAG: hypothetical protein ACJ0GQ_00850 [Parasynechococcus sp.]|jgi:hypothetical protein